MKTVSLLIFLLNIQSARFMRFKIPSTVSRWDTIAPVKRATDETGNLEKLRAIRLRVGLTIPTKQFSTNFGNSAGALALSIDRVMSDNLLPPGSNISVVWKLENCNAVTAVGSAFEMIVEKNVDVLIGSPCLTSLRMQAHIAKYYNIPLLAWGACFDNELRDGYRFPTLLRSGPNFYDMSQAIIALLEFFHWYRIAIIFQSEKDQHCYSFQKNLRQACNYVSTCWVVYREIVDSWEERDIQYTIMQLRTKSRIIVLCFDDIVQLRRFALELYDAEMYSAEYVYLIPGVKMSTENLLYPFWMTQPGQLMDGRDANAAVIANRSLQIHAKTPMYNNDNFSGVEDEPNAQTTYATTNVTIEAVRRVSGWPFYCIGDRALRNNLYVVFTFSDGNVMFVPVLRIIVTSARVNVTWVKPLSNETFWASRDGEQPRAVPICGYEGDHCPINFFRDYKAFLIAGAVFAIAIVLITILGILIVIRLRTEESSRQNRSWKIPSSSLKAPTRRTNSQLESSRSLLSSTSTKYSFDSSKTSLSYGVLMILDGKRVICLPVNIGMRLTYEDMVELRAMRQLESDYVNRFLGITMDSEQCASLWRYCTRGQLSTCGLYTGTSVVTWLRQTHDRLTKQKRIRICGLYTGTYDPADYTLELTEVIKGNTSLNMDGFFIYSLIRDICEGLRFIHGSAIGWHGNLRSTNCLIDDRWQVKLSDYGLKFHRRLEERVAEDLLWTAPEHLRDKNYVGSRAGDVFSFAIICAELVNMRPIGASAEAKADPEGIVYMVRKGGVDPFRPRLEPIATDMSPALMHLIRDCWNESDTERPHMDTVNSLLQSMNTAKSTNLLDHVFNMLEQYAGSLEEQVDERTRELVEEKKKSDILLYRLLPPQVVDKLKLGQSIEPESYSCVTVFFSDVVSFTTLASKCSPLQVVNLLNALYTTFDSIIAEFDVYKVETIGDGYLCVSGLPRRNGNEHSRQLALMSLAFMRNVKIFTVPHLPSERLRLRVGLHTGPCVAGVVGLSMPRYCLFGDTVNTASRMESHSKPMRIHISAATNNHLVNIVGGFVTEERGEVIIKGKGVMETFWLLGLEGDLNVKAYAEAGSVLND